MEIPIIGGFFACSRSPMFFMLMKVDRKRDYMVQSLKGLQRLSLLENAMLANNGFVSGYEPLKLLIFVLGMYPRVCFVSGYEPLKRDTLDLSEPGAPSFVSGYEPLKPDRFEVSGLSDVMVLYLAMSHGNDERIRDIANIKQEFCIWLGAIETQYVIGGSIYY